MVTGKATVASGATPARAAARAGADPARGRLRVVFQLRVAAEAQQRFLDAYQAIRHQVAGTEGHLVDQLCQSTADPAEWVIISEWESPEHFHAWERGAAHRALAAPLVACTTHRRSLRYVVRHQTVGHQALRSGRTTAGARAGAANPGGRR